jgi:hypothetical protein
MPRDGHSACLGDRPSQQGDVSLQRADRVGGVTLSSPHPIKQLADTHHLVGLNQQYRQDALLTSVAHVHEATADPHLDFT